MILNFSYLSCVYVVCNMTETVSREEKLLYIAVFFIFCSLLNIKAARQRGWLDLESPGA